MLYIYNTIQVHHLMTNCNGNRLEMTTLIRTRADSGSADHGSNGSTNVNGQSRWKDPGPLNLRSGVGAHVCSGASCYTYGKNFLGPCRCMTVVVL